ncbi:MAG: CZB domain-containing protein [Candidatus Parabeggiatoa sp.]|nr:CZB domain-containing protein [Candidatus Parabeggiatoa sp.]
MAAKAFFLMRLNDHVQYLKKMESTLGGKGLFQGTTHSECKLGQWLHGDGTNEVGTLTDTHAKEVFDSLFEPHERFHITSKQALDKKQAGDDEGAKLAMTEMYRLSHLITQKLLALDTLL